MSKLSTLFAERLVAVMEDRNINTAALVKLSGIETLSIRKYENGNSIPGPNRLIKICRVLNVSSDYLLGLSNYDCCQFRRSVGLWA